MAKDEKHGGLYNAGEGVFDWMLARYAAALTVVLWHQFMTLLVMIGTITLNGVLFVTIPKGFFPQQDTGLVAGITEAAQDSSPENMGKLQQQVADIVGRDPAVLSVASYIGPGPSNAAPNQGRMFITLKPPAQRPDSSAQQVIDRLAAPLRQVQGMHLFMQAAQDLTIGARTSKAEYQYTLVDDDPAEFGAYATRMVAKLKQAAGITGVSSDQEATGSQLMLTIDHQAAARFNLQPQNIDQALYDSFGSRLATKVYGTNGQYFVIVEAASAFRTGAVGLDNVYFRSPAGAIVRLDQVASITPQVAPVVINH